MGLALFIDYLRIVLTALVLYMPGISALVFLVHIFIFLHARSKSKKYRGSVPKSKIKRYKLYMILSGIFFAISTAFFIALVVLILGSISYM